MKRTGAPLIEDFAVHLMDRNFFLNTRVTKLEKAIKEELSRPQFQRDDEGRCRYCGKINEHTESCRVGKLESALLLDPGHGIIYVDQVKTEQVGDGWIKGEDCSCSNCGHSKTVYREDDRGDIETKCEECGNTWWSDGPDS